MSRYGRAFRRKRGEHGQVLILAVVALILIIIAILLLFDVQTMIRGKIKVQNGLDAAALTAAEWQKHSLNLIGELNLVRATGTLISDPFFAGGVLNAPADQGNSAEFFADVPLPVEQEEFTLFPEKSEFYNEDGSVNYEKLIKEVIRVEKQKRYLDNLDTIVSQLQTRISFVGPLIAFGAAQQAAKNNGLTYDDTASEFYVEYLKMVANEGIYEHLTPVFVNDYAWRWPYAYMLESIMDLASYHNEYTNSTENHAFGISVGTRFKFMGMPSLTTNPPSDFSYYLGNKGFYQMIHGRDWCGLDRLLRMNYNGNWWGSFECEFDAEFSQQSEILPLHIEFSEKNKDPYDTAKEQNAFDRYLRDGEKLISETFNDEDPYDYTVSDDVETREEVDGKNRTYYRMDKISITLKGLSAYNDHDADRRYDLLPLLSWAIFDDDWYEYDTEKEEWEIYLRGNFKEGLDYTSGARAFFEAEQQPVTISGSMGRPKHGSRPPDIGQVFASSDTKGEAQLISGALNRLDNGSIGRIRSTAEAKPLGRIKTAGGSYLRPFEAGRMILPVFEDTALIPTALEPVDGMSMLDLDWLFYLLEFVPILARSPSLEDAWREAAALHPGHLHYYAYYYSALLLLNDPTFRQTGINWLNDVAIWEKDKKGIRHPRYTNREYYCSEMNIGNRPPTEGPGGRKHRGGPSSLH